MKRHGFLPMKQKRARLRNGCLIHVRREPRLEGPWVYLATGKLPPEPGLKLGDHYAHIPIADCWLVDGSWREDREPHHMDIMAME